MLLPGMLECDAGMTILLQQIQKSNKNSEYIRACSQKKSNFLTNQVVIYQVNVGESIILM